MHGKYGHFELGTIVAGNKHDANEELYDMKQASHVPTRIKWRVGLLQAVIYSVPAVPRVSSR